MSELSLDRTFDVAYSRGGAWTFFKDGDETKLASHIFDLEEVQESFVRVAQHLHTNGLLIISTSNAYGDKSVELDNGVIHKRKSRAREVNGAQYADLDYRFYRGDELLAQQTLELRLLSDAELTPLFEAAGFVLKAEDVEQYRVYEKI